MDNPELSGVRETYAVPVLYKNIRHIREF